jgi:drug/metabolite transporter (DMT)-like permease
MRFVATIILAMLLVAAQTCWKLAVDGHTGLFAAHGLSVSKVLGFVFAPFTLLGAALYVVATGLYMFLLSRYQFSFVQAMSIPLSLLFSVGVAAAFFHDHLSLVNVLGAAVIVAGIVLFTLR